MLWILPIIIAIIGTLICAYTDLKTGYLPNKVTHSMVILGAILVPILYQDLNQILLVYGIAVAVFAFFFILYLFGQMGGGDMKLFTALTLLVPFYPDQLALTLNSVGVSPIVSTLPFFLSIYVLFGIIFMTVISLLYIYKIQKNTKKIKDYRKKTILGMAYALSMLLLFLGWIYIRPEFYSIFYVLGIPIALAMMIVPFKKDVIELFFKYKKKIKDLDDDDVLALELLSKDEKKKLGLWRKTFTDPELKKIKAKAKKARITYIYVCENMPRAVPYIFISLIISLAFGDILLYLFSLTL